VGARLGGIERPENEGKSGHRANVRGGKTSIVGVSHRVLEGDNRKGIPDVFLLQTQETLVQNTKKKGQTRQGEGRIREKRTGGFNTTRGGGASLLPKPGKKATTST